MKKKTIAAIDVGTTKVFTAIAEVDTNSNIKVIGIGLTPSQGLHKGMVVNIQEAADSIRESVKKAEEFSGIKIDSAYIGVTGRHVNSLNNKGVVSITRGDRLVRSEDLRRVLQSAQSIIKLPSDRRLIHVIPRSYAVDGQVGVKNPVGMHGNRLDVETHIITAAVTSVQNLVKCVRSVGVDVEDLVLEPVASSEAVLTEDEKKMGVILADIGGGTTDICVFREGAIWHTAVVPVAGYQLTRDIAIGLGIPFEVAEEMKKRYGTVLPVYEASRQKNTEVSTDSHGGVNHQDLCDILRARVEEILRLIILELPRTEYEQLIPAGLVLTGGSSNLSGIATLGEQILKMPVRVGATKDIHGVVETNDPAYATGIGLLLWGARNATLRPWQTAGFGLGNQIMKVVTRLRGMFR